MNLKRVGLVAALFPYALVGTAAAALWAGRQKKMKKSAAFKAGVMTKMAESARAWSRAKRHVAKGHEEEKARLQRKGRGIGGAVGLPILALEAARAIKTKGSPRPGVTAAAIAALPIGHLLGERVALKRLELSQKRGEEGHYAPRKTAGILNETAKNTRAQVWATRRAATEPIKHKPMVVKTPAPKPPQVEPSTQTPTQMPKTAKKKKKGRGILGEPQHTWQGQSVREQRKGPENEPLSESWRGQDF